jgi:pimeloyl-ACP methyl ester carboxylesterase
MRKHLQVTAAFVIIGALVLTLINFSRDSNGVKAPMALSDYYNQELAWEDCYEDFQCSILDVPIDYSDLTVGTFEISVLRYLAADQKNRIGSLIINPGGPGSSGVNYAYNAEYIFSPDITDRYDIVGFDPRGVAESAPIRCFSDSEIDANYAADGKPDNAAELAEAINETKKYAEKCLDQNEYLTAYGTANAARDMDVLREALGDTKLNYMGKSYGTFMGTLYAQLFPDKIGRVVLDGAVDPSISQYEQILTQAESFDNSLTDFLKECSKNMNCSLPTDVDEARKSIITLLATVAKKPIPQRDSGDDKRELTETLLTLGMAAAFYNNEEGWPKLRTAFREIKLGYSDEFIKLADQYSGRLKDGTYRSNEFDSGAIIDCLDFADDRTVADITNDAKKISQLASVFGPYLGYSGLTCQYLPKTKPVAITSITTNAPIMIIGTTRDPATPYQWAIGLQKVITNSQLLTLVGDGHTGHNRGSACIDNAVDNFYLKGVLPPKNKRCIATS